MYGSTPSLRAVYVELSWWITMFNNVFNNVILNDPDGLACTIRRHLACLKTIKGDCICYNGIMRPHTIENIMYRITHIQSLVHIECCCSYCGRMTVSMSLVLLWFVFNFSNFDLLWVIHSSLFSSLINYKLSLSQVPWDVTILNDSWALHPKNS